MPLVDALLMRFSAGCWGVIVDICTPQAFAQGRVKGGWIEGFCDEIIHPGLGTGTALLPGAPSRPGRLDAQPKQVAVARYFRFFVAIAASASA